MDKAKPRQTHPGPLVWLAFEWCMFIMRQKNSGNGWKNTPIPARTLWSARFSAHRRAVRVLGRNGFSQASCVLVLFPPDLPYPSIPGLFSHEKWSSAHRRCPLSGISPLIQNWFSCELLHSGLHRFPSAMDCSVTHKTAFLSGNGMQHTFYHILHFLSIRLSPFF